MLLLIFGLFGLANKNTDCLILFLCKSTTGACTAATITSTTSTYHRSFAKRGIYQIALAGGNPHLNIKTENNERTKDITLILRLLFTMIIRCRKKFTIVFIAKSCYTSISIFLSPDLHANGMYQDATFVFKFLYIVRGICYTRLCTTYILSTTLSVINIDQNSLLFVLLYSEILLI